MKKILPLLTLMLLITTAAYAKNAQLVAVSYSDSTLLPTVENCVASQARTTKLNTVSGEKGYWVERDYTAHNGKKFHAVWIDGAGPVGWNAKKISGIQQDGIWGNGATFKSVTVSGFDANLEFYPPLGLSLAIRLPKAVLTIESQKATEEEILSFAQNLIATLNLHND